MMWVPVEDSEATRGLTAMIVFNGLHEYADCRLCRQVPDAGSVLATPDRVEALEYILSNSVDEYNETLAETQTQLVVLRAMLQEMKGEATDVE